MGTIPTTRPALVSFLMRNVAANLLAITDLVEGRIETEPGRDLEFFKSSVEKSIRHAEDALQMQVKAERSEAQMIDEIILLRTMELYYKDTGKTPPPHFAARIPPPAQPVNLSYKLQPIST